MAKFVQIVGKEEPYEVLRCLRCQRIFWMVHQGKVRSRICPFCTRRATTVISADAKQNVVNCVVCEKIIEDTVFVCDHCGFTTCLDCVRVDGSMLYCLECWVK
jgi:hypothetical protein